MNSISYIANKVDDALRVQGSEDENAFKDPPMASEAPIDAESHAIHASQQDSPSETQEQQEKPSKQKEEDPSLPYIVHIILFIPNLLIVRPLLFSWLIITYPLTVVEQIKKSKSKHNNEKGIDANAKQESKTPGRPSFDYSGSVSNLTIVEMDEEVEKLDAPDQGKEPNDLKSPTSPSNLILSNPKQFSFPKTVYPISLVNSNVKKTLILDLDETLVHTLSRGTRMSNGYMVEVKLKDQVATLYSVHKRPYCDLFLKQVSKWYNLVIFTASIKEYADPVIDLLETERKYFSKRFYRNHCTLRDGEGYIKDLTAVDKSLTNMIIIDNSPISYALHENNAIIVEGWINDPSDSDLLNLIPLLNALRYTTDVRPILSLKNGEVAFEG